MKEINIREVKESIVALIADDWGLLTAKSENGCNPMTVSWGSIGELWGKDTATVYVRESRFTKPLMDKEDYFSLCFFNDDKKDKLAYCGSKSGRDTDKVNGAGLTAIYDEKAPYFKEAKIAIICKKAASLPLDKSYIPEDIKSKWYSDNDFHTIYFGEIEKVLISD